MPIATVHGTAIPANSAASTATPALLTDHVAQQQSNWCWAACFEMIRNCLNLPPLSQSRMARAHFGDDCDEAVADGGLRCTATGPLPLSTIQSEIGNRRPVALQIDQPGRDGHVVLVVGCVGDMLEVHDPRADHQTITFAALQAGHDGGTWMRSYYGFAANEPTGNLSA